MSDTHLPQGAVGAVGAGPLQVPPTLAGWEPHSDPEPGLGPALWTGGHRGPPALGLSFGQVEEGYREPSEGSAEVRVDG